MNGDPVKNFEIIWQHQVIHGLVWLEIEAWNRYTMGSAKIHTKELQDRSITSVMYDHGVENIRSNRVSFHIKSQGKMYRLKNLCGFVMYEHKQAHLVYVHTPRGTDDDGTCKQGVLYNIERLGV